MAEAAVTAAEEARQQQAVMRSLRAFVDALRDVTKPEAAPAEVQRAVRALCQAPDERWSEPQCRENAWRTGIVPLLQRLCLCMERLDRIEVRTQDSRVGARRLANLDSQADVVGAAGGRAAEPGECRHAQGARRIAESARLLRAAGHDRDPALLGSVPAHGVGHIDANRAPPAYAHASECVNCKCARLVHH